MSEEFSTINITSVSYPLPPPESRRQPRKAGRKIVRTGGQGGPGEAVSCIWPDHFTCELVGAVRKLVQDQASPHSSME